MNYGYTRELMPDGRSRLLLAHLSPRPPAKGQIPLFPGVSPLLLNHAVLDEHYVEHLPRMVGDQIKMVNVHGVRRTGSSARIAMRKISLRHQVWRCETLAKDEAAQVFSWTAEDGANWERGVLAQDKMRLRRARKQRAARLHAKVNSMLDSSKVLVVRQLDLSKPRLSGEISAYIKTDRTEDVAINQGHRTTSWSSWKQPANKRQSQAARDAALERLTWADPGGPQPESEERRRLRELEERVSRMLGIRKGGK